MRSARILPSAAAGGVYGKRGDCACSILRISCPILLNRSDEVRLCFDGRTWIGRTICDLVTLDEIGSPRTGRPRAVITLDDGHIGNADLLPVFIRDKVRPTIFLCSRIVGRPARHWWLHPGAKQAGIECLKRLKNEERLSELGKYGYHQEGEDQATGLTVEQLQAMRPYVDF